MNILTNTGIVLVREIRFLVSSKVIFKKWLTLLINYNVQLQFQTFSLNVVIN